MRFFRYILTSLMILFLYSCFASMSMEFNSARTYARIEDNLVEAEKWALLAMEIEPDNSQVPWFLANEVYRPQKKKDKVAEMFKEALNRKDADLEKPFKSGEIEIIATYIDEYGNTASSNVTFNVEPVENQLNDWDPETGLYEDYDIKNYFNDEVTHNQKSHLVAFFFNFFKK